MFKIPLGSPYAIPSQYVGKSMFMVIFRARDPSWNSKYTYTKGMAKNIQIDLRNKGVRILEGKFGEFRTNPIKNDSIDATFSSSIKTLPEGYYTCITIFGEPDSIDDIVKRDKPIADAIAGMIAIKIDPGLVEERIWEGIGISNNQDEYQYIWKAKPPRGAIQVKEHTSLSFSILEPYSKLLIEGNLPKSIELSLRWYQRSAELDMDTDRFIAYYLSILAIVEPFFSLHMSKKEIQNSHQMDRFEFYIDSYYFEQKDELMRNFRKIYNIRNNIFHESKLDLVSISDLIDIQKLSELFLGDELNRTI